MPQLSQTVGHTRMVSVYGLGLPKGVQLLAKLEGDNPAGSVKDRAALYMIDAAQQSGALKAGVRLVEPTSGNTGIGLAMIAASKGLQLELVMPDSATPERVKTMEAYGAKVRLTPADQSMEGAIDEAKRIVAAGQGVMLDQFSNPANPQAHYETTGPEIWDGTDGRVTHFVSAMGTTGTIMGCARFLKERNDQVQIVGVQPADGADIPGIRRWPKAYLPKIFDPRRVDCVVDVTTEEAVAMTRQLARQEGILCGMSGGGAMAAARRIGRELTSGVVVVILPDRGDRYLSGTLFS